LKKITQSKWVRIPYFFFLYAFSLIGFGLTVAYLAIHFRWTDEKGSVDKNSRYLSESQEKYKEDVKKDSIRNYLYKVEALQRISILNKHFPKNAQLVLTAFEHGEDVTEVLRMLDAIDLSQKSNVAYHSEVSEYKKNKKSLINKKFKNNAIEWMNVPEWETLKIAIQKDKHLIDSVEKVTGVEGRLIVACLVGEQIRLFNSNREIYKSYIGPLKVLSVESKFSFGVTGIKEHTAQKIEGYMKDKSSVFYLGEEYENLLDFSTDDSTSERISRLTNYRNHYYSYLYAALFLKQVKQQWEKEGFPIDKRPEVLVTLFNVGFPQSKPKSNPKVGGSTVKIHEVPYTFGMIGYHFYYSGELFDAFPIHGQKFDWNKTQNS
jgi:hypothetical protein